MYETLSLSNYTLFINEQTRIVKNDNIQLILNALCSQNRDGNILALILCICLFIIKYSSI